MFFRLRTKCQKSSLKLNTHIRFCIEDVSMLIMFLTVSHLLDLNFTPDASMAFCGSARQVNCFGDATRF